MHVFIPLWLVWTATGVVVGMLLFALVLVAWVGNKLSNWDEAMEYPEHDLRAVSP